MAEDDAEWIDFGREGPKRVPSPPPRPRTTVRPITVTPSTVTPPGHTRRPRPGPEQRPSGEPGTGPPGRPGRPRKPGRRPGRRRPELHPEFDENDTLRPGTTHGIGTSGTDTGSSNNTTIIVVSVISGFVVLALVLALLYLLVLRKKLKKTKKLQRAAEYSLRVEDIAHLNIAESEHIYENTADVQKLFHSMRTKNKKLSPLPVTEVLRPPTHTQSKEAHPDPSAEVQSSMKGHRNEAFATESPKRRNISIQRPTIPPPKTPEPFDKVRNPLAGQEGSSIKIARRAPPPPVSASASDSTPGLNSVSASSAMLSLFKGQGPGSRPSGTSDAKNRPSTPSHITKPVMEASVEQVLQILLKPNRNESPVPSLNSTGSNSPGGYPGNHQGNSPLNYHGNHAEYTQGNLSYSHGTPGKHIKKASSPVLLPKAHTTLTPTNASSTILDTGSSSTYGNNKPTLAPPPVSAKPQLSPNMSTTSKPMITHPKPSIAAKPSPKPGQSTPKSGENNQKTLQNNPKLKNSQPGLPLLNLKIPLNLRRQDSPFSTPGTADSYLEDSDQENSTRIKDPELMSVGAKKALLENLMKSHSSDDVPNKF